MMKHVTLTQADTFNRILLSAERGFKRAIILLLNDIFTNPNKIMLNERKLESMLDKNYSTGFIYFLLGDLYALINNDAEKRKDKIPQGKNS
jgi:hypothetical protein